MFTINSKRKHVALAMSFTVLALAGAAGRSTATAAVSAQPAVSAASGTGATQYYGLQTFAGSTLTQARAQKMAEDAGFDLVSFYPCAYRSDDCAMMEVERPHHVFVYQLSSDHCALSYVPNSASLDDFTMMSSASSPVSSASSRAKSRTAAPSTTTLTQVQTPEVSSLSTTAPPVGSATYCFAGYVAGYRVREENTAFGDYRGHQTTLSLHYQLIDGTSHWTDVLTSITSAWDLSKGDGSGFSNTGWAYDLRDGSGTSLVNDGYTTDYIASSGAGTVNLKDRCQAVADSLEKKINLGVTAADGVCKASLSWLPDSIKINISMEPLGLGGAMDVTKNQNLCGGATGIANAAKDVLRDSRYTDCLNNPGRYFPADYPPPAIDFVPVLPKSFTVAYATDGEGVGFCASTETSKETADMGNGMSCTADVQRSCAPTPTSSCYCTDPKVVGDIVCTQTGA